MAGTSAPPAGPHYYCVSGTSPNEQKRRSGEEGRRGRGEGKGREGKDWEGHLRWGSSFYFEKSASVKGKGNYELTDNTARISLDSKCNIQVAVGGKHYDFTYTDIEIADYDGKEAILITIDKKNRIWLFDGTARLECKKIGKNMILVGAKSSRIIMDQLKIGTFRM